MRWPAALAAALAVPAAACDLPDAIPLAVDARTTVFARFAGADPGIGEYFSMHFLVCRDRQPWSPPRFAVDAAMPAHNHGMNYRASIEPAGPGRFDAAGLLLHMPGLWRFEISFDDGARGRAAGFDYRP